MKKIKLVKKTNFIFFVIVFLIYINFNTVRDLAQKYLPSNFKIFIKNQFFGKKYLDDINYYKISNYNQKILPETEFLEVDFKKIKLINISNNNNSYYNILNNINENLKKKFYITTSHNEIFLVDSIGSILKLNYLKNFEENILSSNIKSLKLKEVKHAHVIDNDLYITYSFEYSQNCDFFKIAKAKLNQKELIFKNFFSNNECHKNVIAGRMSTYFLDKEKGLLVTTGSDGAEDSNVSQLNESFYGKILFFNLVDGNHKLISKGHRNPQGLTVFNNNILSTEHGPRGGDEINLIKIGGNYGWPITSYGEPYGSKSISGYKLYKDHSINNFIEPIYTFVPSIGISQIIKMETR